MKGVQKRKKQATIAEWKRTFELYIWLLNLFHQSLLFIKYKFNKFNNIVMKMDI